MSFTRFALFVLPDHQPLAAFGAAWLGWDARAGVGVPPPSLPALPIPLDEITLTPRKYGFHGTMKPPFGLADGQDLGALRAAFAEFCGRSVAVRLDGLKLAQLGRFLALVPSGDTTALETLAAEIVRAFDPFRAPLTPGDLARRRQSRLSPRQDELLQQWGYPYVMEEFRFHLTMTGKLPKSKTTELRGVLEPILEPLLPTPFTIGTLSLVGEDADGRFQQIETLPLTGST